jgi:hypothetical protein
MRRRILWAVVSVGLALIIIFGGAVLSLPMWNLPDRLPALPDNSHVHYQPGAEDFAREVAALYPDAVARVEGVHGRRFAQPVIVGAYARLEAWAAASRGGSGIALTGRVNLLRPQIWRQRQGLRAELTWKLSLAHIRGWVGANAYIQLPNWFKQGLAVMVSDGVSERVSEEEARAAIQRGERLLIDDASSLTDVRLEKAPADKPSWYRYILACREAGLFLSYLRKSDRPAFDRMMNAILDGRPFVEAVTAGYHDDPRSLWEAFIKSSSDQK